MLTSLKLNMYQKLNDPAFLFKAQYALNPITVLGFLLLAPVLLAVWLLSILFAPIKLLVNGVSNSQTTTSDEDTDDDWLTRHHEDDYLRYSPNYSNFTGNVWNRD